MRINKFMKTYLFMTNWNKCSQLAIYAMCMCLSVYRIGIKLDIDETKKNNIDISYTIQYT